MPDGNKNKAIDPISLQISGLGKQQANQEGYMVRPMTLEESWETNKHILEKDGMTMNQFPELYKQVYGNELNSSTNGYLDEQANKKYEWTEDIPVNINKKQVLIDPKVLGYTDPEIEAYQTDISPGKIGERYDMYGQKEYTMTAEQTAETKGFYIAQGLLGPEKKDLQDYYMSDYMGTPFKFDSKTGKKTMLTLDPRSRTWVEADSNAVVGSRQVRSIWGPQEARSGILENIATQSYNTIIDETLGAAGTVSEVFGMMPKLWGGEDWENYTKWGLEMQNYTAGRRSKVSEAVEHEGAFGSWRAGLGTAANALTQVGSQALVGLITRGASAPLQTLAKGSKIAKGLYRAINGAPWAFGAAYAMQAMNDEAKSIGASDEARAILSLSAAGAVFAAEKILHSVGARGLADMFEDGSFNNQLHRQIRSEIGDAAKKSLDEFGNLRPGGKEAFEKEMKRIYEAAGIDLNQKVSKSRIKQMATNAGNWMRYSDKPGSFAARMKGFTSGALEEGSEEWLEAIFNGATKTIYNEGFADPNAKPGQGKFDKPWAEVSLSTFAAGMIGGGAMGFIRGVGRKPNMKGIGVANLATQMSLEDGKAFLADMHKKGRFHNSLINVNGQFINSLPKDEQTKAKSMNDLMYEQYVGQLEAAHDIMNKTGLADPEMLTEVLGNDSELQRDVLVKFMENRQLKQDKEEMERALEEAGEDSEKRKIAQELDKLNAKIAENSSFTEQVMDGTAQDKYNAILNMRALELNRNTMRKLTGKEVMALSQEDRDELFQQSLSKAKETDGWTNRDQAIARFKQLQEWNANYKNENDRVEEMRARGDMAILGLEGARDLDDPNATFDQSMDNLEAAWQGENAMDKGSKFSRKKFDPYMQELRQGVEERKNKARDKGLNSKELQDAIKEEQKKEIEKARENKINEAEAYGVDPSLAPDLTAEEITAAEGRAKAKVMSELEANLNEFEFMYDEDFWAERMKQLVGDEAFEELANNSKQSSRLKRFEDQRLEDDRDKMLVRKSASGTDEELELYSAMHDIDNPKFEQSMDFVATTADGTKYRTSPMAYLQARQEGKDLGDDSFEYEGQVFSVEPSVEVNGQKTVKFNHKGQERHEIASRTSKTGQQFIKGSSRDREVHNLYKKLEAMGGDPDQALVEDAKALRDSIQDDVDTLELMMELAQKGILTERVQNWLGMNVSDAQSADINSYYFSLLDALDSAKNLYFKINQASDVREENFRKLNDQQVKWGAQIINQLGDQMTTIKVLKNGKELEKPSFPDPTKMTAANLPDLVKAMQYYHLYFQQADDAKAIQDLRIFWHRSVAMMEVDFDGKGNPIFTGNPIKSGGEGSLSNRAHLEGGQLNDFTDLLDWENFVGESPENGMPFKRVVYYDFLNMIFNSDPQQVYKGMLDVLDDPSIPKDKAKFPGAHTSEQLMIAMPLFTHIIENAELKKLRKKAKGTGPDALEAKRKLDYHDNFKTVLKGGATASQLTGMFSTLAGDNKSKKRNFEQAKKYYQSMILDHFRLVTGSGGSGKTSFITMTALQFALNEGYTNKDDVVIVAPNAHQLEELKKSLKMVGLHDIAGDSVMLIDDFLKRKDEGKGFDNKFIIIDEVSLLSREQRARSFATNYARFSDVNKGISKLSNTNTVIVMGDELQAPLDPITDNADPKAAYQMQHGMNLTQVKRTDVKDVFFLQAGFRRNTSQSGSTYPVFEEPFSWHSGENGKQSGVRTFDKKEDFFSNLKERMDASDEVVLIVYNKEDEATALGELGDGYKDRIFVMRDVKRTPQGRSFDEVYVYMPRYEGMKELDSLGSNQETYYNRFMGTAVGRARKFVGLYTGDGVVKHNGSNEVTDERDVSKFVEDTEDKYTSKKQSLNAMLESAAKSTTPVSDGQEKAEETKKKYEAEAKKKEENKKPEEEEAGGPATDGKELDLASKKKGVAFVYDALSETDPDLKMDEGDIELAITRLEAGKMTELNLSNIFRSVPTNTLGEMKQMLKESPQKLADALKFGLEARTNKSKKVEEENPKTDAPDPDLNTNDEGVVTDDTENPDVKKEASYLKKLSRVVKAFGKGKEVTVSDPDTGDIYDGVVINYLIALSKPSDVNPKWMAFFEHRGKRKAIIIGFDGPTMKILELQDLGNADPAVDDNEESNTVAEDDVTYDKVDDKDGGSIEVDPEMRNKESNSLFDPENGGSYFDKKHGIYFKAGVRYNWRRLGENFTGVVADVFMEDGEVMVKFKNRKKPVPADKIGEMVQDYVNAVINTIETVEQGGDVVRLTSMGKLSVLNYYTDNPDYEQGHKDLKANMDQALKKGSVRVTIKGRKGGTYYSKEGNEYQAAFMIDVFMDGKRVGMIPISAVMTDVENHKDKSAYYEILRKWLERKVGTNEQSIVIHDQSGVDPRDVLGDTVRYVPGKNEDKTKSRSIQEVISEIRSMGGKVREDGIKQVKDKNGNTKLVLEFEYFDGVTNKGAIELEALKMSETPAKAEEYLNSLIEELENAPQSKVKSIVDSMQFLLFNFNQLSRDMYAGSEYATLMDDLLEPNPGMEPIEIYSTGAKVPVLQVKRSDLKGDEDLRNRYLDVLEEIKNALISNDEGFNLRMPTTTADGGVINVQNLKALNIKTVNNVQAVAPKLYFDIPLANVLGVSDTGGELHSKVTDNNNQIAYDMTYEQMAQEFRELLGDDFDLFGSEELIDLHGKVTQLGSILLHYNTEGKSSSRALYHEVAHYVAEFLMGRDQRNALYGEIAVKLGITDWQNNPAKQRQIAEAWAEMSERYASDRRNLTGVSKFLKRMMDGLMNFFRKIGMYKSLADQYMYDIYVMKEYKGKDGKMMPRLYDTLEDAYGEQLNKAKNYAGPQAVINYYEDKDNATRAQHTVTQEMSKHLTVAGLSNRSFKQDMISYKDVINRVEYSLRSQVMFNTDNEGRIIRDKKGFPQIREDKFGNRLQITNEKGQSVDLFKYMDVESGVASEILPALHYFDKELQRYVRAPLSDNGIYFFGTKNRDMIRSLMRSALRKYQIETQISDGFGGFEMVTAYQPDAIGRGQVKDINDLRFMEIVGTINDDVLLAMIQRNFQSIEVKDLFQGKDKNKGRYGEVLDRMIEAQDTVARKESNQVSALDRMSTMVKFIVNTIPVHYYDGKKWVHTNKFVRMEVAQDILNNLPMMSYNPRLTSTIDMMRDALLKRRSEMRSLREGGNTFEDEQWVAINSIYETLFNDDIGSMSHLAIIRYYELAMDQNSDKQFIYDDYIKHHQKQKNQGIIAQGEEPLSFAQFFKMLPNRAQSAYDLLASLSVHFGSIARDSYKKVTVFSSGENAKSYVSKIENTSVKENKDTLNRNLDARMFDSDGSIGTHYRNLFGFNEEGKPKSGDNDYDAYTTFDMVDGQLGIYYNDKRTKTKHKLISIDPKTGFTVTPMSDLVKADLAMGNVIRSVFQEVYGETLWWGHADRMAIPRGENKNVIGWEDFADMIGPVMASAYTYSAETYFGEDAAENAPFIKALTAAMEGAYGKNSNYGKTTQAAIDATRVSEEEGEQGQFQGKDAGDRVYFPTAFFDEVNKFAQFLTAVRGGAKAGWGSSVRDKRMNLDTVQDMAGYRFTDKGRALVEAFREEVEAGGKINNINQVGGEVINPMLGYVGFVDRMDFMNGYKKGKIGRELDQLTERDNWDIALDDFMSDTNASLSNWKNIRQGVFMMNHGDRSRQRSWAINWRLGGMSNPNKQSNGLLIKRAIDGNNTFEVDAQNMMVHVLRNYKIAVKAQARSINKWVNFYMNHPLKRGSVSLRGESMTEEDFILDSDLEAGDYDKVKRVLVKVTEMLQEDDLFTVGNNPADNPDLPVQLFGTDLKMGEDFVVLKQNKDDAKGKVVPGFATRLFGDIKGKDAGGNYMVIRSPVKWLSSANKMFRAKYNTKDGLPMKSLAHAALKMGPDGSMFDSDTAKKLLFGIFRNDLHEANRLARKAGFKLYSKNLDTDQKLKNNARSTRGFKVAGGGYYEPIAAMVMAHSIQNAYHMFAFEGTYANHLDYMYTASDNGKTAVYTTNANKRMMQHSSTMQLPNFGGYKMIDPKTRTLHIAEPLMSANIVTADKDGSISTNGHSPFDGQGFVNPLHALMLWHSYGGANGVMDQYGNLKTQSVQSESGEYYKHSLDRPTAQSMELMPKQRMMVEIMLNPTAKKTVDGVIQYESDLDTVLKDNDSLWQRFLLYENESYYYRAVEQMQQFVDDNGGIENLLKNNLPQTEEKVDIESWVKDYRSTMDYETMMFKYDKLKTILSLTGLENEVVPVDPKTITKPDGDWALNKLLDFYAQVRHSTGSEAAQEMYPYISHIEIDEAARKQKGRTLPIPVAFDAEIQSSLVPLYAMQVGENIPNDLFSSYLMHKEAGQPMELGSYTAERNNLEEGMQLNANRQFDDSLEAPMVQMMSLLISSPHLHSDNNDLGDRMMKKMGDIMETAIAGFEMEESAYKDDHAEANLTTDEAIVIQRFLKEKIKFNLANQDDSSMMGVIVNNDKIHISASLGTEERMFQYLASYFRKNVVKRKVEAMRLVQASGMMVQLFDYQHPSGRTLSFTAAEAKRYGIRNLGMTEQDFMEGMPSEFTGRGLKSTVIRIKEGYEMSESDKEAQATMEPNDFLRKMINDGKAEIIPGEIVMPGAKFAKYNIPKNTSINELYTFNYYDGDQPQNTLLHDLAVPERRLELKEAITNMVDNSLQFYTEEVNGKTRTTLGYKDNMKLGENPYFDLLFHDSFKQWLKKNQRKVRNMEKQAKSALIEEAGGQEAFLAKYVDNNNMEQLNADLSAKTHGMIMQALSEDTDQSFPDMVNMMVDGLIAIRLTTERMLGVRTPSGPGSTFFNTTVYIINDNGSTGYVNTIKNEIDGSDMDIDQFSAFYKSDTMRELGYGAAEIEEQKNKWKQEKDFDSLTRETTNELNNELMDMIFEYYQDPQATDMTMNAIGLAAIKQASKGAYERMFPSGDHAHNFGHTVAMRILSMDGKAVGPSANAQKGQNYLMAGFQAMGKQGLNSAVMPILWSEEEQKYLSTKKYRKVPGWIEALINAATDNPKLMTLGTINVNIGNMSTVANAHFANKLLYDFVDANRARFRLPEKGSDAELAEIMDEESALFDNEGNLKEDVAVYLFFQGEAHTRLFNRIKEKGHVKEGEYSAGLMAEAHNYYSTLVENTDKYENEVKASIKEMDTQMDRIRDIMSQLVSAEDVQALIEGDGDLTSDAMKMIKKLSNTAVKKEYLALSKLLQARMRGDLKSYGDEELTKAIEEELAAARNNFYEDAAEITNTAYKKMGLNNPADFDAVMEKGKEFKTMMSDLFKALRKYERAQRNRDNNARLSDDRFKKEVLLVAKYAFFGDFMDRWTKIVGINQFQITSAYDAYTYNQNLKFMTGFDAEDLTEMWKIYKAGKFKNAAAFMEAHPEYKKDKIELKENAMNMYKHRMARKSYSHMTEKIGDDEVYIDYMEDMFQMADVTELLLSLPPIMESINAAFITEDKTNTIFISRKPEHRQLLEEILEDTGQDTLSERKYRSYFEEIHKYVTGQYLARPQAEKALKEALSTFGFDSRPLIGMNDSGRVPGISDAVDADTFIMQFPLFWENRIAPQLTELQKEGKLTNKYAIDLIKALRVKRKGTYTYLEVANPASFTQHEMSLLREGYKALPKEVQDLLALYQLTKDGFSYKSSAFLSQIISEEWYEDFSSFLEDQYGSLMAPSQKKYLKYMLLSNLKNGLAPRAQLIEVGTEKVQMPPIGANGPVKYYNKQIHKEWTRFGIKEQRALSEVEQHKMVMPSRSEATTSRNNIIVAKKDIIDTDLELAVGATHPATGTPLKGITVGAYFNYIIKGNIDRIIEEQYAKSLKDEDGRSLKDIQLEVLNVDWMNANYQSEYRREAYKFKDQAKEKDAKVIKQEVASLYQKYFAKHFRISYKDNPEAFDEMVLNAQGKVIADAKTYSSIGLAYQLSTLFNQLTFMKEANPESSFYELLSSVRGFPEETIPVYDETFYLNMHSGKVGNYYRKGMLSEHVLEVNPEARTEMGARLGWGEGQTILMDEMTMNNLILKVWSLQKDAASLIDKKKIDSFKAAFADVLDTESESFLENLAEYIAKNGSRKHREDNIDYKRANQHAIVLHDKSNIQFSMLRRSSHNIKMGDIVYFKDGSIGVVNGVGDYTQEDVPKPRSYTYYLVPKPRRTRARRVRKAIMTLEDRTEKNNARGAVESLVRTLSKSMEGTPYRFISTEEQNDMGVDNDAVSFFADGVVYINLDRADAATAIHEFAHPYVIALKNERPELYEALANSVRSDQELMDWVRRNYPELLTEDDILMEAIPTFIQMRYYAHQHYQQSDSERAAWSEYFDWVKGTFTQAATGQINSGSTIELLDFSSATLTDFADAIINDLKSGESIPWLSNVPYTASVPYTMKAKSSSKVKNIKLENIDQLMQRKADYSSKAEKDKAIRYRIDEALTGKPFIGLSGSYNFNESNPRFKRDGKIDYGKREKYIRDAMAAEAALMDKVSTQMRDFFDAVKEGNVGLVQAAKNHLFKGLKRDYKEDESLYEKYHYMLSSMLIELNYNPTTDRALSLSEATKRLGINLPTNIKVEDEPLVIIHNEGKNNQQISILNITTLHLLDTGAMNIRPLNQAFAEEAELNKRDRRNVGSIQLQNTRQDINAFRNGIIAMAMVKENPELSIRRVGTVQVTGYEGKPFKKHYKEMSDIVPQIEKFFGSQMIREGLERDLYNIVTDKELLNPERYVQDTLDKLGRYLESALAQEKDREKGKPQKLQEALDLLQHVQEDHVQARMPALARAIKSRLDYLRIEVFGNDQELVDKSTEYQDLAYTYLQLTGYNEINTKKVTPITYDEKWIDTADRWHGQIRTWVFDSLDQGLRKSKEELMPFQETIDSKVKTLIKMNPQVKGVTDTAHALFKKLFKTTTIKDRDGNKVEVSTHELHWDKNAEDTKKLISDGVLQEEEVDFANWLADQMYEEFVQYIMDVERTGIQKSHNDTEEELRAAAEKKVATRYKKGMMPVFIQTGASALSEGNIKKAFEIYTQTAGSWYGGNIFDEYQQSTEDKLQKGAFHKLLSPFWSQFKSVENYGSDNRLKMLGLGRDTNGDLVLLDSGRQETLSFNLENIGLFTQAASMRARHLKEGVAKVNIALDLLRGEQALKGTKVDDIIVQIENYVNRQVYGNLPKMGKMQVAGVTVNVDNMLDASGQLIHMVHLAANAKLGAKNMSSQAMKLFTNSIVNAISGNKQFNTAQVMRAVQEVITNPKKVEALNKMYQVVSITERDLLNHFKNNITRKNVFETEFQMIFHWFGDHYTQLIGAMAQMMKDGTYDAHTYDKETGKITYDEDKDLRFQEEDGDIIKNAIKRQQNKEEYHAVGDGKLTHAYSQRQENRLKVIVQRYVSELNDTQYKNMISSYGLARAVMSLKTYMFNVKQNWFKVRRPEVQTGDFKVVDKNGKKEDAWVPDMVEGVLQTWMYMGKFLAGKATGTGEKIEWDAHRTRNMVHTATAITVIAGVYYLVDLMSEGFDDDEDKRKKNPDKVFYGKMLMDRMFKTGYIPTKDQKEINYLQLMLRYIIGGAANEQLSYANPTQIVKEWGKSPNPYIWQAKNTWDALTTLLGFPMALYNEDENVAADMDQLAYAWSKTLPYGNNYRTLRNAYMKISEDVIDETLNANYKPK